MARRSRSVLPFALALGLLVQYTAAEEVVSLDGASFEKHLQDNKHTLVEFYAPWCGHCKKMQPEYEKLAAKIKKEDLSDLLSIAWIDGTANDSPVETMDWSGFPTLYFVKAGQDKPTLYEGERTAKGIWRYIRRHATKAEEIKERLARKTASENRGAEL
mmetsp:Transcript_25186/g.65558  ORF Transcript_25186/g.65558 Transcript_25186/m.65558 type:complete len:159 (+) Transcript_25186:74-550(+)